MSRFPGRPRVGERCQGPIARVSLKGDLARSAASCRLTTRHRSPRYLPSGRLLLGTSALDTDHRRGGSPRAAAGLWSHPSRASLRIVANTAPALALLTGEITGIASQRASRELAHHVPNPAMFERGGRETAALG
jgi:hypothetical protein